MVKIYIRILLLFVLVIVWPTNSRGNAEVSDTKVDVKWINISEWKSPEDPIISGDDFQLIVNGTGLVNLYGYGVTLFYDPAIMSPINDQAPFDSSAGEKVIGTSSSGMNKTITYPNDQTQYGKMAGRTAAVYLDFLNGEQLGKSLDAAELASIKFKTKAPITALPAIHKELQEIGEGSPIDIVVQLANDSTTNQKVPYEAVQAQTFKIIGNVNGTIVKDGLPVKNVPFSLHSIGEQETWYDLKTDENGEFDQLLPDGDYLIEGIWLNSESVWYPIQKTFTVKNGILLDQPKLSITLTLPKVEGNVDGTLVKWGNPLKGVGVSIQSKSSPETWYDQTTDASGNFSFKLPDGDYIIHGIWIEEESKWCEKDLTFSVKDGNLVDMDKLMIEVVPEGTNVKGLVKKGDQSISSVWVSIHTTDGSDRWYDQKTDHNGQFLTTLPDGSYQINGIWMESEKRWYPKLTIFSVVDGKLLDHLRIDLNQPETGKIPGVLMNGDQPLKGVAFSAHTIGMDEERWVDTSTNEDGTFFFYPMSDGTYQIDGVWVDSEKRWYPLSLQFQVRDGDLVGRESLTVELAR